MAGIEHKIRVIWHALQQPGNYAKCGFTLMNVDASGSPEEIRHRLLNLASAIGVRDQRHIVGAMLKNATLKNALIRILRSEDFFPIGALAQKRPHAVFRAPIQIVRRIVAVPESLRNRNDSLMLIVC